MFEILKVNQAVILVDIKYGEVYFFHMESGSPIYVFHITRPDGKAVFIHPLDSFEKIISKGGVLKIEGKYGSEPAVETLTAFRNTLYTIVEEAVNSFIAESRFIPRFLSSAAVFMVLYFFLSFAIRDPVPMIDEIIISLAVSVFVYIALGKKYRLSGTASKLRGHYRSVVDRVVFKESGFAEAVEKLLENISGREPEEMAEILEDNSSFKGVIFSDRYREERSQFFTYLGRQLKKKKKKKKRKIINRIMFSGSGSKKRLLKKLDFADISGSDDIDICLLMLYLFYGRL